MESGRGAGTGAGGGRRGTRVSGREDPVRVSAGLPAGIPGAWAGDRPSWPGANAGMGADPSGAVLTGSAGPA